ncbi:hypothetical protein PA08_1758 [Cutibacterium modestum P08]|nr:hypothetical protein PA08_1758 [Cutibacterium modestum P08]
MTMNPTSIGSEELTDDIEPDAAGTFRAFQYRHRRPEDHFDEHLMVLGGSVAYIPMF